MTKRPYLVAMLSLVLLAASQQPAESAIPRPASTSTIADVWPYEVRRFEPEIVHWAQRRNIDPDLIAAIVLAESAGNPNATSYVGAVGLMGVMPQGPGFEFRPTADELLDPATNLSWGTAILVDILRQAGGDLAAALAAYNGGWQYAAYGVPRGYALEVLHYYGRAVAGRAGHNPDNASLWTVAVERFRGHLPVGAPPAGTGAAEEERQVGRRLIYSSDATEGLPTVVQGYAVPLRAPLNTAGGAGDEKPFEIDLHLFE